MSVLTKVLFVGSALFAAAGVLVGWVIPLVDGRTANFAIERAQGMGEAMSAFRQGMPDYAREWLRMGTAWMNVAYVLLAVGGLLLVLAVVALVLNLSEQNRKLKAAA